MLGNIKRTPEQEAENQAWRSSMIEKAKAKGLEYGVRLEDVKVGDVLMVKEYKGWGIKKVEEKDIVKEYGFLKIFGRSFPTVTRFTF